MLEILVKKVMILISISLLNTGVKVNKKISEKRNICKQMMRER